MAQRLRNVYLCNMTGSRRIRIQSFGTAPWFFLCSSCSEPLPFLWWYNKGRTVSFYSCVFGTATDPSTLMSQSVVTAGAEWEWVYGFGIYSTVWSNSPELPLCGLSYRYMGYLVELSSGYVICFASKLQSKVILHLLSLSNTSPGHFPNRGHTVSLSHWVKMTLSTITVDKWRLWRLSEK